MNINQFIQEYRSTRGRIAYEIDSLTPHVMCQDGFTMSVQAGKGLYSSPNDTSNYYEAVEVGYPSEDEPALEDYADGTGVFAYVPSSIVDEIIEKHGGIDTEFHNEVKTEAS